MPEKRLRQRIAFEAARLLRQGREQDYPRAKRLAARRLGFRFRPRELPSNREVREQLEQIERFLDSHGDLPAPRTLRLEALRVMRQLRQFEPRLLKPLGPDDLCSSESVLIQLVVGQLQDLFDALRCAQIDYELPDLPPCSGKASGAFPRVRLVGPIDTTLIVLSQHHGQAQQGQGPRSSLGIAELERSLLSEMPNGDLDVELLGLTPTADRFEVYRLLLEQLEEVSQDPCEHPEGDALYHSLQVFDLALKHSPYDEELLTAALLHDVGKLIDSHDPVAAGLDLLEGLVTHRTRWLIAHFRDPSPPPSHDAPGQSTCTRDDAAIEDLALLAELNEAGRKSGAQTTTLDEAIDYLRRMDDGSLWE